MNCHALKNDAVFRLDAVKGFMPSAGYEQTKETIESVVTAKRQSCHSGCEVPVIGTADEYWTRRIRRHQGLTLGFMAAIIGLLVLLYLKK